MAFFFSAPEAKKEIVAKKPIPAAKPLVKKGAKEEAKEEEDDDEVTLVELSLPYCPVWRSFCCILEMHMHRKTREMILNWEGNFLQI